LRDQLLDSGFIRFADTRLNGGFREEERGVFPGENGLHADLDNGPDFVGGKRKELRRYVVGFGNLEGDGFHCILIRKSVYYI